MSESASVEYTKVAEIKGPLIIVDGITKASFDELVEIETTEGERRLGRVLEVQRQNFWAKQWQCQFRRNCSVGYLTG